MNQPPYLTTQHGQPSVPSTSDFHDVVLWDYSFSFHYEGDVGFTITYNEERTVAYSMAIVDAGGTGELRLTAESGPIPMVSIPRTTAVPTGNGCRYQNDEGAFLTAEELVQEAGTRTVTIEGLSIVDTQSARATVEGVTFPRPLLPLLVYEQPFLLEPAGASLADQLTAVLQPLLGPDTFPAQPLSLECHYGYTIGGLPVVAPVVLVPRQDFTIDTDAELIAQIATSFAMWKETVQPPTTGARIVLKVELWNALLDQKATLLQLASVSFPI